MDYRKARFEMLTKNYRSYLIITFCIMTFELVMILYGSMVFDFTKYKHIVYFTSYIILFLFTLATYIVLSYYKKKEKPKGLNHLLYLYSSVVILWGMTVSMMDMTSGNYPIVFLTCVIAVAALTGLNPYFFAPATVVTAVIMSVVAYFLYTGRSSYANVYNAGYYVNLVIFIAVAIFINIRLFRSNNKQYRFTVSLKDESKKDSITGAYNRKSFYERLDMLVNRKAKFKLIFINILEFSNFNLKYGHERGDKELKHLAMNLQNYIGNTIYRFEGVQFCIITEKSEEEIVKLIEEINSSVDVVLKLATGVYVTRENDSVEIIVNQAKKAMIKAVGLEENIYIER